MYAWARWILQRLGFLVGFVLFALSMFDLLPGLFLFAGFVLYGLSVMFWRYPHEGQLPSGGRG